MSLIQSRPVPRTRRPAGWGPWLVGATGLGVFGVCLVAGFNIGFAAGRTNAEPTRRAEKSGPEFAKVTPKPSPPVAATQPVAAKGAAKPDPVELKPVVKPEVMAKTDVMEKPEPVKKPAAKDDEPAPKKPEPKKPDPTPEPKKPEPKRPEPKKGTAAAAPTFAKVSAVLQNKCAVCHGAASKKAGLDVRALAAIKKGGDGGPAVVPGDLAKSPLWDTIDTGQMPPPGKEQLTDDEKTLIKAWIAGGAK